MALVAFLRGVNVGGHKTFRPSALAEKMPDLGVTSVGAAGTFVVRNASSPEGLRARFEEQLHFDPELFICHDREILDLVTANPFHDAPAETRHVRRFLTVMAKPPRALPPLPLEKLAGIKWEVRVIAITGRFAFSLWRRVGHAIVYPNAVIEKSLGIPSTTRSWDTISAIADILNKS
ncbi:MAG TPA: DUF1697 domain-containing protein [Verrucomicrobiae bacterium]|nr:DUF1697 domain-containing protein [Verrucomicrobiae bacterium]